MEQYVCRPIVSGNSVDNLAISLNSRNWILRLQTCWDFVHAFSALIFAP